MHRFFYACAIALIAFEVGMIYLMAPLPFRANRNDVDTAYLLYTHRWAIRAELFLGLLLGYRRARKKNFRIANLLALVLVVTSVVCNFFLTADHMYYRPRTQIMREYLWSKIDYDRLVVGIQKGNESRAYPLQFLAYHHQIIDGIGGRRVMITYCPTSRKARAYFPEMAGRNERFYLIGMQGMNSVFEDVSTRSWWSQETGIAIAGKRKGMRLPDLPCEVIMQPDPKYVKKYELYAMFEKTGVYEHFTYPDSIRNGKRNQFAVVRNKNSEAAFTIDSIEKTHFKKVWFEGKQTLLVLSADCKSCFAFQNANEEGKIVFDHDSINDGIRWYDLNGYSRDGSCLDVMNTLVEYW
jgi:hypothetical protein